MTQRNAALFRSANALSLHVRFLTCAFGALFFASGAQAQSRPVRLQINNASTVAFQSDAAGANGQSIAYFANNTATASNRRVMQLRVADPVLCADYTTSQIDDVVRLRITDATSSSKARIRAVSAD